MEIASALGNYFLSVWLWSITWGIYHVPLAIVYSLIVLKVFLRMSWVASIMIALSANLFSWASYTLLVLGVFALAVSFEYIPTMPHAQIHERMALIGFSLGLIYTVLQVLLCACTPAIKKLNVPRAFVISLIVNMLAALSVYMMLPLYC